MAGDDDWSPGYELADPEYDEPDREKPEPDHLCREESASKFHQNDPEGRAEKPDTEENEQRADNGIGGPTDFAPCDRLCMGEKCHVTSDL